jgi:ELWxxDGT repeat protein
MTMPAKRSLVVSALLAIALAMPIPARAVSAFTVVDSVRPGTDGSGTSMWDTGVLDGWLYTMADDGVHGHELWRTNGDATTLVADINTGSGGADSSYPYNFAALGGWLYFIADDGVHGWELWRTNGTDTSLVKDINETAGAGSDLSELTTVGGYVFFGANDGMHGAELWRTDGTTTVQVLDINAAGDGSGCSCPNGLTPHGHLLFFSATDGVHGTELWAVDSTDGTTVTSWDINQNSDGADPSNPGEFRSIGPVLYFAADGGDGVEPWGIGASLIPEQITDINQTGPSGGSYPAEFTLLNDMVYFSANDGVTGYELWRTDGNISTRVADINSGISDSGPDELTVFNGQLYFQASDAAHGVELWKSDGATVSPSAVLVHDINNTDAESSYPWPLRVVGDALWFSATAGGDSGYHLVRMGEDEALQPVITPGTNATIICMCRPINLLGGRIFVPMSSDETGAAFGYVDEPTYVLPETDRERSAWAMALLSLAALTAAAAVHRRRTELIAR